MAPPPADPVLAARPRILVRSDSQGTSLGEGTVDPADPRLWPAVLSRLLADRGQPVDLRNASSAGLTIEQALRGHRVDPLIQEPTAAADVVVVALGINDWWPLARPRQLADVMERARPLLVRRALHKAYKRARPTLLRWTRGGFRPTPPERARQALRDYVELLVGQGRSVVLMTPFPVRSPKNPLLDGNTWEACDAVCQVAAEVSVPVVDCRQLFEPIEWETISVDHIHVNEAGQVAIAEAVAKTLLAEELLVQPRPSGAKGSVQLEGAGRPRVLWRVDPAALAVDAGLTEAFASAAGPGWHVVNGACAIDVHDELRSVQHDPLVREQVEAADVVVLSPALATRPSAWDRERLHHLIDVVRSRAGLVLVHPASDSGARTVDAIARDRGVRVVAADASAVAGAVAEVLSDRASRPQP